MILKEPSFFFQLKIVEKKSSYCLLPCYHSVITLLAKSFLISAFMIFVSCSLCGALVTSIIPGLPLKLIFRPYLIISRITLSLIIFRCTMYYFFKLPAIKFVHLCHHNLLSSVAVVPVVVLLVFLALID